MGEHADANNPGNLIRKGIVMTAEAARQLSVLLEPLIEEARLRRSQRLADEAQRKFDDAILAQADAADAEREIADLGDKIVDELFGDAINDAKLRTD